MCVDFLHKAGADKDAQDSDGSTALMCASGSGQHACVDLLLKAEADKDAQTKHGCTALMCASSNGQPVR